MRKCESCLRLPSRRYANRECKGEVYRDARAGTRRLLRSSHGMVGGAMRVGIGWGGVQGHCRHVKVRVQRASTRFRGSYMERARGHQATGFLRICYWNRRASVEDAHTSQRGIG